MQKNINYRPIPKVCDWKVEIFFNVTQVRSRFNINNQREKWENKTQSFHSTINPGHDLFSLFWWKVKQSLSDLWCISQFFMLGALRSWQNSRLRYFFFIAYPGDFFQLKNGESGVINPKYGILSLLYALLRVGRWLNHYIWTTRVFWPFSLSHETGKLVDQTHTQVKVDGTDLTK